MNEWVKMEIFVCTNIYLDYLVDFLCFLDVTVGHVLCLGHETGLRQCPCWIQPSCLFRFLWTLLWYSENSSFI